MPDLFKQTIVINLTRFGDLLQTQAVFNGLAKQGYENTLVCLENFSFTADLLRNVHHVRAFPGADLLRNLDKSWIAATLTLRGWVNELVRELALSPANSPTNSHTNTPENLLGNKPNSPVLLINLTPALPGRILNRLLEDQLAAVGIKTESRGFGLDPHGFSLNHNHWAAYLLASCQERGQSHFNLVDVFYRTAGLPGLPRLTGLADMAEHKLAEPEPTATQKMRELLYAEAPADCAGFVAFQLGASTPTRRWPVEYFCKVGQELWKQKHLCPVLLGTRGESPLAEEYQNLCHGVPLVNLCGRTSPLELAATLRNCRLLLTNDTGTMHLAAGLGVDILAIFLVTAQACDTGPYLAGTCLLEPDMPCHPCPFGAACPHEQDCRYSIKPELVTALALSKLNSGEFTMPSDESTSTETSAKVSICSGTRVWVSVAGADGLMDLRSISEHENDERSILFRMLRHFQRQLLDRKTDQCWAPFSLQSGQKLPSNALKECAELEGLLHLLSEQARMLLSNPLPMLKTRFLAGWQRTQEAMSKSVYYSSIGRIWLEETQNLGDDLSKVTELTDTYRSMFAAIRQSLEG